MDRLESQLADALKRLERLERENLELKARLNQNSRNSSKPPSSDPPSAPSRPSKSPSGRAPGGQPGHEGSTFKLVPVEEVDQVVTVKPQRCAGCGHRLSGADPDPKRHQITEIPPVEPVIIEYLLHRLICPNCSRATRAELPPGVPTKMIGPALQALIGYFSGRLHLSKRAVQEALEDLFGVSLSLGSVSAAEQEVSRALAAPVGEAHEYVQNQPSMGADETGWTQRRRRAWLWTAVTTWVTVFQIHLSRGAEAARILLGRFCGILTTDRWNGYNGYPLRRRQLCWAHLIRDFVGFTERGRKAARIGEPLLIEVDKMFALWKRVRDGTLKRSSFQVYMTPIRHAVESLLRKGTRCGEPKTEGMCKMILKLAPALWTFVRVDGVEPTNNASERAIRPAVLYRKGCFGTHSAEGSRFVERILTVVTTLRQQGRNVLGYLTQACVAAMNHRKAPSLLPRRRAAAPSAA
jgi:transposase